MKHTSTQSGLTRWTTLVAALLFGNLGGFTGGAATLSIPSQRAWTDTGVTLTPSDTVTLRNAVGSWTVQEGVWAWSGPEGAGQAGFEWDEWITNGRHGMLIGFVGGADVDPGTFPRTILQNDPRLFEIGTNTVTLTKREGRLWIGINDGWATAGVADNRGVVEVEVGILWAEPVLSGVALYEGASDGASGRIHYWNTVGGDPVHNVYLLSGTEGTAAFLNGGDSDSSLDPGAALGPGIHRFRFAGDVRVSSHLGLNLYFDGDLESPRITAVVAMDGSAPFSVVGTNVVTTGQRGVQPGAGSLAFETRNYTVTLTDFRALEPTVDLVSPFTNAPGAGLDTYGSFTLAVEAKPVRWDVNGHYYQPIVTAAPLTWPDAVALAEARGGYLATLASAAENAFVADLISSPAYWGIRPEVGDAFGPWIGAWQNRRNPGYDEPSGGWEWIDGEAFVFAGWAPGEPNEWGGIQEDYACFWIRIGADTWNDVAVAGGAFVRSYVVEFDREPGVPGEPPRISAQSESQSVPVGNPVALTVSAEGTPPLLFRWFKDGRALPSVSGGTLAIPSVGWGDAGEYSVTVSNAWGSATGRSIRLRVVEQPFYTLQVLPSVGGLVLPEPLLAGYPSNATVKVTAIPAQGWSFVDWFGDVVGGDPVASLTVDGDRCIRARFGTTPALGTVGNGTVSAVPAGEVYVAGETLQIRALPAEGHYFSGWGGNLRGDVNPATVRIDSAFVGIRAHFEPIPPGEFALLVFPEGQGTIEVSPRSNRYPAGSVVRLSASPRTGQMFLGWQGDASGQDDSILVTVDRTMTIRGGFSRRPRLDPWGCVPGVRDGSASLVLTGERGGAYQIEVSTDLRSWEPWSTVTHSFESMFLRVPRAAGPSAYFRARAL